MSDAVTDNFGFRTIAIDGNRRTVPLGTMRPGEEIQLTLPEINSEYHFDIVRRDGSVAAHY